MAIKAIEKTRSDSDAIRREIEILRRVGSHRNIVELKDVFETDTNWYLVMELVTGGDAERLVRHGPAPRRRRRRSRSRWARRSRTSTRRASSTAT